MMTKKEALEAIDKLDKYFDHDYAKSMKLRLKNYVNQVSDVKDQALTTAQHLRYLLEEEQDFLRWIFDKCLTTQISILDKSGVATISETTEEKLRKAYKEEKNG